MKILPTKPDFSTLFVMLVSGHAFAAPAMTMPSVSEEACPLVSLNITSQDGNRVTAFARKPPGKGPFPALIHLHGGLGTQKPDSLKHELAQTPTLSRFLAAGYVTVGPTYRSREQDPQTRDALMDCLAVVEHVKRMPEVDSKSVVLWGDSGGGSLALELAGETDLAAITVQEPATVLFTGVFNNKHLGEPKSKDYKKHWNEIMERPRDYLTPELEKFTRAKIAKIQCPVLITSGGKHAINKINNEIFVPELKSAGKHVEEILYPGEPHGFSRGSGTPEAALKFFEDSDRFFKKYLATRPNPLPESLAKLVPVRGKLED